MDFIDVKDNEKDDEVEIKERKAKIFSEKLEKFVMTRFKELEVVKARMEQKTYEENVNENDVRVIIGKKIKKYLKKEYSVLISPEVINQKPINFLCFRIDNFTSRDLENCVDGHYENISEVILEQLCRWLYQHEAVEIINKNSFESDETYIEFLRELEEDLIIGSNFLFNPKSYFNKESYSQALEDKKCIFTGFSNCGLIIDSSKMHIYIHRVNVNIHPGSIEDSRATLLEETGMYSYDIMAGMPAEFTKEELEEFLHNKRKIVDVYVSVSIQRTDGCIGKCLVNETDY